jgi:two-component system sensor histidine kinase KdpD
VDAQVLEMVRAQALGGNWGSAERIVVAVNEQTDAAELVRATRRMADALHAPWTAVHVETPRSLGFDEADRTAVADAMQLAAQLGARLLTLPAPTVVEGLKLALSEAHATQLIIGKSARSRWFELRHGSVVDRLVRELPGIAVHVLPFGSATAASVRKRDARASGVWGRPWHYTAAAGLIVLVTALGTLISSFGSITNAALLYLVPVMLTATRFGLRPALVAALASSLAYNFFFIPPLYTFTIEDPQNIITVLVLLGVAVVSSKLAAGMRDQAQLAQASARQNASLAGFARVLTGTSRRDELATLLCDEVARLLGVQVVLLTREDGKTAIAAALPPMTELGTIESAAAQWTFANARPSGNGSDTLAASEWRFQPVMAGVRVYAVLGIARADARRAVRPDQLPLLLSLLDQAGLAFERIDLEERMAALSQERERDRLREALLSSVSHDLRTPLTTAIGLLSEIEPTNAGQRRQLVAVRGEVERINRFVANLLDMVRIESGSLQQSIEPVDLAEAVAAAAHDLRRELADHPVRLGIAPDLPLVQLDPRLFHHCLINLLDNAAKYGQPGSPVDVNARRLPDGIELVVADNGPGIPTGDEQRIFDSFTRLDMSDRTGGTGLGLAIVKGFADAMGLVVRAGNRRHGPGAELIITVPTDLLCQSPREGAS